MSDPIRKQYVPLPISSGPRRARRAEPRVPVCLAARVMSGGVSFGGTVRDIGIGGLFVECSEIPAYGQRIDVEVHLDVPGPVLHLAALVRWTRDGGFGAQLLELDARATHAIASLVRAGRH